MATVLIVEDDPLYGVVLQTYLRSAEHQCILAGNVPEMFAILIARRQLPTDLVILDWRLPGGGGARALEWLRGDARLRTIPVLVVTAAPDADEVGRLALARGAAAFLSKKADTSILHMTVERLLHPVSGAECPLRLSGTQALRPGYEAVALTANQAELLRLLLEQPGKVVPHPELESRLLPYMGDTTERAVPLRMRVQRLNVRLQPLDVRVRSRRSEGYYLEVRPGEPPASAVN
jgi:two-component system chemotaxis response regulator CheY